MTRMIAAAVLVLAQTPFAWAAPSLTPKEIYRKSGPAVVLLMCTTKDGTGELGTGSLINAQSQVLTNAHVVIDRESGRPYASIRVYLKPQQVTGDPTKDLVDPYQGTVVKFDRELDFAVVSLDRPAVGGVVLPLADSSRIEAGEPVIAIGHPEQGGLWTLTKGVVGAVIADLGGVEGKDVFQSDASINRGNSGGPLIDLTGSMVGINTSMARKATDGLAITSVNFAVKSNVIKKWLASSGIKTSAAAPAGEEAGIPASAPAEDEVEAEEPEEEVKAEESEEEVEAEESEEEVKAEEPGEEPEEEVDADDHILTPKKPFSPQELLKMDMAEMRGMADDMKSRIQDRIKKRPGLQP